MKSVLETIHDLRSIHGQFSTQRVEEASVNKILEASVRAANSSYRQAYSIVTTRDRGNMKEMGYVGSVMFIYCADFTRQIKLAQYFGFKHPDPNLADFTTASTDAVLAAQTAVIAAKSLGIESLITNCIHRGDINRVYQAFNLPEKFCFPVIAVVFGYPEEIPKQQKQRLDDQSVIHKGTYKMPDLEECRRISRLYDSNPIGLMDSSQWRKNGYEHYLEWFFEKWRGLNKTGVEQTEEKSHFQKMVEKAGFV